MWSQQSDFSPSEQLMKERSARPRGALRDLLPAALLLVLTVVGTVLTAGLSSTARGQVAVLGAPWAGFEDVARIVAGADGSIIAPGGLRNVVIARASSSDFVIRLYEAGAWLVLDWDGLTGCLASQRSTLS